MKILSCKYNKNASKDYLNYRQLYIKIYTELIIVIFHRMYLSVNHLN